MTERLERDLKRAIEAFIAAILAMAQRAAIEAIRSAFVAWGNPGETPTGGVRRPPSQPTRRRRAPVPASAVSARLVAFVREHPGSSTAQISQSLGLSTGAIRQHLRQLADQRAIRFAEEAIGGITRRTYFEASRDDEQSAAGAGGTQAAEAVA